MDSFSNPSSDGRDYSISGVELVDNGDLKIYEVKESANGTPMLKSLPSNFLGI